MTPHISYPIGFCRNGHLWKDVVYRKPNGKFFCRICNYKRKQERRSLAVKFPERVQPAEVRLLMRLDKTPGYGPNGDCWIYTGETRVGKDGLGYGQLSRDGKLVLAHRLSWEMEYGPIPDGKILLHKCDNPPCCRPDHLTPGTQGDNVRDMMAKGRGPNMRLVSLTRRNPSGERNGMAKHTWEEIREIRVAYATGIFSMTRLAKKYNTNSGWICNVINHVYWKEK